MSKSHHRHSSGALQGYDDRQSALRGRGERSDDSDSLCVGRTIERQNTLPVGRSTARHFLWVAIQCQNHHRHSSRALQG